MSTEERNHVPNGEGDGEEQEDEKMEQFFALLRNFREARNKRRHELRQRDAEGEMCKKNKTSKSVDDERSSWVPKFEWEDFTAEIVFPAPCNKKDGKKKQEEDDGLDLTLSLSSSSSV